MTIREYLKKRGDRFANAYVAAVLVLFVVSVLAPGSRLLGVLLIVGFFAITAAFAVVVWRTPCPRCARSLGNAASAANNPFSKRGQYCPHCGVNVDEQMESPAIR
jgi:hypothetical protein